MSNHPTIFDELNRVFAFSPNILAVHHFFLRVMYLKTLSAKRHTCCWAFVLSEIFCGRNQRSRVKTHIIFPPSLCNWSVTVSHRSQGAKGVHGQSDKSEKSDLPVPWAVSIQFGILEMEETVRTRYHFSSASIHMLGPKSIPLIENLQLLRYERDIH